LRDTSLIASIAALNPAVLRWRTACIEKRMKQQNRDCVRTFETPVTKRDGLGPDSGGQSGDTQGLTDIAEAGPESIAELVEEGQSFEADAISGVEAASGEEVTEVHTKQVLEDDVPIEYLGQD